jgi:ribonuclease Z
MPTAGGYRVEGLSVGGIETAIDLPDLKLAFDVGRSPEGVLARETILFTHGHMDHMGGIAYHAAMRALKNLRPPTYVVPPECAEGVRALFEAWARLDHARHAHSLVVLAPGEEWQLRPGWIVKPFRSPHSAPCQGYGIWRRREKLRPELAGLSSEEVGRRKLAGERVTESTLTPEIAFTGDARIEVVEREEVVRTARLLILEVTFLDDRVSVADARKKGHVHLDEVVERAELFQNEALVLTHFSSRYTRAEIEALLAVRLPDRLRERAIPLLAGHREH